MSNSTGRASASRLALACYCCDRLLAAEARFHDPPLPRLLVADQLRRSPRSFVPISAHGQPLGIALLLPEFGNAQIENLSRFGRHLVYVLKFISQIWGEYAAFVKASTESEVATAIRGGMGTAEAFEKVIIS
jgi:hypothetical protein